MTKTYNNHNVHRIGKNEVLRSVLKSVTNQFLNDKQKVYEIGGKDIIDVTDLQKLKILCMTYNVKFKLKNSERNSPKEKNKVVEHCGQISEKIQKKLENTKNKILKKMLKC